MSRQSHLCEHNSITELAFADLCCNFFVIFRAICLASLTSSCDLLDLFGIEGINRRFASSLCISELPSRCAGMHQADQVGKPIPVFHSNFVGPTDIENQIRKLHAQTDANFQKVGHWMSPARNFASKRTSRHFFGDKHGRPMPMHNCRIGEASHPGPDGGSSSSTAQDNPNLINLVITNPTAVYQKARCLNELGGDLLMLSETSATTQVQTLMSKEFKQLGYKSIWGHPAAQQIRDGNPNSLRGAAVGVSVHSKLLVRPARLTPDTDWFTSGRFLHCFVQFPGLEIQVCTVYGLPASVFHRQAQNRLFT